MKTVSFSVRCHARRQRAGKEWLTRHRPRLDLPWNARSILGRWLHGTGQAPEYAEQAAEWLASRWGQVPRAQVYREATKVLEAHRAMSDASGDPGELSRELASVIERYRVSHPAMDWDTVLVSVHRVLRAVEGANE